MGPPIRFQISYDTYASQPIQVSGAQVWQSGSNVAISRRDGGVIITIIAIRIPFLSKTGVQVDVTVAHRIVSTSK